MMTSVVIYISAFLLDRWFGDPTNWPHPIRWIGTAVSGLERRLRLSATQPKTRYVAGGILWLVIVGLTGVLTWLLLFVAYQIHWVVGVTLELWLAFTVLAGRCLEDCAHQVLQPLRAGDIGQARVKLAGIVGRDTKALDEAQIARATVETVAENTVDGVVAPLFYLFIGGVPLAMAYKAVNTLDSMVGYKNERYREMGYVSARIDDLANYLPARLSWLLFTGAAWLLGENYRAAFSIGWRDRYQHKSPNCAWSEAAVAGALNIRLGGPNDYFGQRVDKPWIGDNIRTIEPQDIVLSTRLMTVVSWCALFVFTLTCVLID